MKKIVKTIILLLTFLSITIVTTQFVNLVNANPFWIGNTIDAPSNAIPINILVDSPKNNSVYNTNNLTLSFNATTKNTSLNTITRIHYIVDWLPTNISDIIVFEQDSFQPTFPKFIEYNQTFQIPDGNHTLIIYAGGIGEIIESWTRHAFSLDNQITINFKVDTIKPLISILSVENKIIDKTEFPLNFMVNEPVSIISYVLDNQNNVTIGDNSTLSDLSEGVHNITVYATDFAGNVGSSETLTFMVDKSESFPIMPITASIGVVAIVSVSLLIYFKKHKQGVVKKL